MQVDLSLKKPRGGPRGGGWLLGLPLHVDGHRVGRRPDWDPDRWTDSARAWLTGESHQGVLSVLTLCFLD